MRLHLLGCPRLGDGVGLALPGPPAQNKFLTACHTKYVIPITCLHCLFPLAVLPIDSLNVFPWESCRTPRGGQEEAHVVVFVVRFPCF